MSRENSVSCITHELVVVKIGTSELLKVLCSEAWIITIVSSRTLNVSFKKDWFQYVQPLTIEIMFCWPSDIISKMCISKHIHIEHITKGYW